MKNSKFSHFFNYLQDTKGKKIPLKWKLLYDQKSITGGDLIIKGDLTLNNTNIKMLPDGLNVSGNLNVTNSDLTLVPKGLYVGGIFYRYDTPLEKKYSRGELRHLIEKNGGKIVGHIF